MLIVGELDIAPHAELQLTGQRLGESEVQDLHLSVGCELDVARFQIPVDHAILMACFQRMRNLQGDGERFLNRQGRRRRSASVSPSTSSKTSSRVSADSSSP